MPLIILEYRTLLQEEVTWVFEIAYSRRKFRTVTCHSPDARRTVASCQPAGRETVVSVDGFDRYCVLELA